MTKLSTDLSYSLLVVARGYVPQWIHAVTTDQPSLNASVRSIVRSDSATTAAFRLKLVDGAGDPVPGAVVQPIGYSKGIQRLYGSVDFVDPIAVSDSAGLVVLEATSACDALVLRVRARTAAPEVFADIRPNKDTTLVLREGVTISGRVFLRNRPAAGIVLGIVQLDAGAESFVGPDTVGTNAQGEFVFTSIPSQQDYAIYGIGETTTPFALQTSLVTAGEDGSHVRLGNLPLRAENKITGRVSMKDGGKLPPDIRLLVLRPLVWNSMRIKLGPQGEFSVPGLANESITLLCNLNGYRLGPRAPTHARPFEAGIRLAVTSAMNVDLTLEQAGPRR